MCVKGHEGNAQALGLLLGTDGGGDGDDVLELAGLEFLAEALDCLERREGGKEGGKEMRERNAWLTNRQTQIQLRKRKIQKNGQGNIRVLVVSGGRRF